MPVELDELLERGIHVVPIGLFLIYGDFYKKWKATYDFGLINISATTSKYIVYWVIKPLKDSDVEHVKSLISKKKGEAQ